MEYYIRRNEEADARGPFTIEQLQSLVEAGQVDTETFYYDSATEQWSAISSNTQLRQSLFPEKQRLRLKPKEHIQTINTIPATGPASKPIEVEEMLAAAEGRTVDTKGKRDPVIQKAKAARLGMAVCCLTLLVSCVGLSSLRYSVLEVFDWGRMAAEPLLWIGVVDLALSIVLFLGVAESYPWVRFRALAGLGFLAVYFAGYPDPLPLACLAAGSLGLYMTTLSTSLPLVILTSLLSLGGTGGMVYLLNR